MHDGDSVCAMPGFTPPPVSSPAPLANGLCVRCQARLLPPLPVAVVFFLLGVHVLEQLGRGALDGYFAAAEHVGPLNLEMAELFPQEFRGELVGLFCGCMVTEAAERE